MGSYKVYINNLSNTLTDYFDKYNTYIKIEVNNQGIAYKNDSLNSLFDSIINNLHVHLNDDTLFNSKEYTKEVSTVIRNSIQELEILGKESYEDEDTNQTYRQINSFEVLKSCVPKNEIDDIFPFIDFDGDNDNIDEDTELVLKMIYLSFLKNLSALAIEELNDSHITELEIIEAINEAKTCISKDPTQSSHFFALILENLSDLTNTLAPLLSTIAETINDDGESLDTLRAHAEELAGRGNSKIYDDEVTDIKFNFKTLYNKVIKKLPKIQGDNLKVDSDDNLINVPKVIYNHNKDDDFFELISLFRANLFSPYVRNDKSPSFSVNNIDVNLQTTLLHPQYPEDEYDFQIILNQTNFKNFIKLIENDLTKNASFICFIFWHWSNIGKSKFQCFNNAFGGKEYFIDQEHLKAIELLGEDDDKLKILFETTAARLLLFNKLDAEIGEIIKQSNIEWSTLNNMYDDLRDKCLHADNFINFECKQFSRYSILDVLDYFEIIDMYRKCRKDHLDHEDH